MRFILIASLVSVLAGCIDVDNLGPVWGKAVLDPKLPGEWIEIFNSREKSSPTNQRVLRFTVNSGAYVVQGFHNGEQYGEPQFPLRTLQIGPYHFLVLGPKEGWLYRYEIRGSTMMGYRLNSKAAWTFIKKNYPYAQNIFRNEDKERSLHIAKFDRDVFDILANLPNTTAYWRLETRLEKVQ